ncbi:MAG: 1-(5-phosphoribosyl)-5-[(5-phosphoribosylamino)methylideneamino] imidazole-4-carboxamide isomerase [Actinomycetota bacterium]|jgi:phosphoribosylformimino-5-aminoimidazole carboxamide ribotide isomerase|nr:1-(5-phosphoribosyl)-5-[(5-phosphoribosylamino)methylideneamino] imidazole-4-carboxamide isomerase [Actinomycetota bacterium]
MIPAMDLWPAIDILGGRCVRLVQGDFGRETRYGDPLEVAEWYLSNGAERLHLVDLDAARTGLRANREVIGAIVRSCAVPVQVGGGVRDEEAAESLFSLGVARAVLGTAAVDTPEVADRLSIRWPNRIVAGLDYRRNADGVPEVAVRGWTLPSGRALREVLDRLSDLPLAGVVVTDIERDGTLEGPDVPGLLRVLSATRHPVVASGGVGSADDLKALRATEVGGKQLAGVIVGRALLSGALALADALDSCRTVRPAGLL